MNQTSKNRRFYRFINQYDLAQCEIELAIKYFAIGQCNQAMTYLADEQMRMLQLKMKRQCNKIVACIDCDQQLKKLEIREKMLEKRS
ncbi:hypothetical protein I4U23_022172 [Adineta vaga]|nr:hypothetical protein I4U23_022172 [Adineta vaga]